MSSNAKKDPNDPNQWFGTREVIPSSPCGFCRDGSHKKCPHEIGWFDKLWICGCDCNKSWKPVAVEVTKKSKAGSSSKDEE